MKELVKKLVEANKKVWITTNGFLLTKEYIALKLYGITGVNISIHHYDLNKNKEITHVKINENNLIESIKTLHFLDVNVRMNCNVIAGYIDNLEEIITYAKWAKSIGADKIRFAELKQDDEDFVDLAKILNYKYGLNDNPFIHGCNSDCVIEEMPVNFRQMCGLQTSRRIAPQNPKQVMKQVLYYDGIMYDGWQTNKEDNEMKTEDKELYNLIDSMTNNKLNSKEIELLIAYIKANQKINVIERSTVYHESSSGGCQY
jgi:hypothetical protein